MAQVDGMGNILSDAAGAARSLFRKVTKFRPTFVVDDAGNSVAVADTPTSRAMGLNAPGFAGRGRSPLLWVLLAAVVVWFVIKKSKFKFRKRKRRY